jgi:hypothetical protein
MRRRSRSLGLEGPGPRRGVVRGGGRRVWLLRRFWLGRTLVRCWYGFGVIEYSEVVFELLNCKNGMCSLCRASQECIVSSSKMCEYAGLVAVVSSLAGSAAV